VPSVNSRRLAERIQGAKLCMLPGVGHAFRLEAEAASFDAISAFLSDHSRPA